MFINILIQLSLEWQHQAFQVVHILIALFLIFCLTQEEEEKNPKSSYCILAATLVSPHQLHVAMASVNWILLFELGLHSSSHVEMTVCVSDVIPDST